MNFGLTETGFSLKRLPDILDGINTALRAQFGTDVNLDPDSALGQLAGTFSKGEADIWELLEAAYHSQFRVSAEGAHLDAVGELIAIQRAAGTFSTMNVRIFGAPEMTVPAGTQVVVPETGAIFIAQYDETFDYTVSVRLLTSEDEDYTLTLNDVEFTVSIDAYSDPQDVVDSFLDQISNDEDFSFITPTVEDDGSLLLASTDNMPFTFSASGNIEMFSIALQPYIARDVGPSACPGGTELTPVNPVAGFIRASAYSDAVPGTPPESDSDYRNRMLRLPKKNNLSTAEGMRQRILNEVAGVVSVTVLCPDDTVLGGGPPRVPDYQFEVVVEGGNDADVAKKIWETKPVGIQSYLNPGDDVDSRTGTFTDSEQTVRSLSFTRPKLKYIWINVMLMVPAVDENGIPLPGEGSLPADWKQQVIKNVLALGENYGIGDGIVPQKFYAPVLRVSGIQEAWVTMQANFGSSPDVDDYTADFINIGPGEKAYFSESQISFLNLG